VVVFLELNSQISLWNFAIKSYEDSREKIKPIDLSITRICIEIENEEPKEMKASSTKE
jgi:hypothetical protein